MTLMEGTLWKWTNYLSGWQPRFFVLEVGVLAYYKSQEEVGRGSKGSIKMGCCEISVHPTDNVRIDLKIPPDQYIYLRAATSAERQQWLVALGTSKACLTRPQPSEKGDSDLSQMNQLKDSMQELSMYRSLLLQQVNTIKLLCIEKDQSQEFSEATTMLSATCDEFLKNLCDCMDLADANFGGTPDKSTSKHSNFRKHLLHESHRTTSPPSSPTSPTSSISSSSFGSTVSGPPSFSVTSENSTESDKSSLPRQPRAEPMQPQQSANRTVHKVQIHPDSTRNGSPAPGTAQKSSSQGKPSIVSEKTNKQHEVVAAKETEPEPSTFFSTTSHKFEDVTLTPDKGIPTKSFLAACSSILPFFDVLGSTAFAPVKMDIGGNIKKLSLKFDMDPKVFHTLQNMIYQEINSNTCTVRNSATDALLWLKRALEFMQIFLLEVLKGTQDLAVAASVAYEKTLRKYHGWVVRGVFALAVKAVPYREDFLTALGTVDHQCAPPAVVLRHIKFSVTALGNLLDILNHFYRTNKLDADYTV